MIIGKDVERVAKLESNLIWARVNFASLAEDLKVIGEQLKKDGVDYVGSPYWRLWHDIGKCEELAEIGKK